MNRGRSATFAMNVGALVISARNLLFVGLVIVLSAVTLISGCASQPAAPSAAQHPDLSGVWLGNQANWSMTRGAKLGSEPDIPYTPWALERIKGVLPGTAGNPDADFENTNDPSLKYADPLGFPRQYQHPLKFKIVQKEDAVYQFWEWNKAWREITLNKPHSEDPDISWYGESVGKWEGDALVVDSIGFKDATWMDGAGHPHSEELRVIERMQRIDPETLRIDFTFEDPIAYTHPWNSTLLAKLVHDGKMTETVTTMSDELHYRERFLNQKPSIPIRR
jgi:hypothetical protein